MAHNIPTRAHRATGAPLDASTVPAAFQRTVARHADRTALQTVDGSIRYTWRELADVVRRTAAGLAAIGVGHGDTLAILLPNTVDCHVLDYAANHLGAVPFSIFNSAPAEQIAHQLRRADAAVVITSVDFRDKVAAAAAELGTQITCLVLTDGGDDDALTLAKLVQAGDDYQGFDFERTWRNVDVDDLATLIYTSGTTGPPKAAQWSHRTVMSQQRALDAALPLPTENIISFMPMAHAGGRISVHYMALAYGAAITVCPDHRQLMPTLTAVRPDAFFAVPRFWEKIRVAIEGIIDEHPDGDALRHAMHTALHHTRGTDAGATAASIHSAPSRAEFDSATDTLKPIVARLGLDRIKSAFVGGAPSTPELSEFFRSVGVPMLEAYGLTEGSLNVFNRVEQFKSGTAGLPLPGVEVRLAGDGELLIRSECNFVDYRHQPDVTAEALDAEGWLHSGDIATIDDDGFVRIIDRKKEIIINSSGKNMSPVTIESAISAETSLIGQIMAIGDRRKYVTALITLDPEAVTNLGRRLRLPDQSLEELARTPEVHQALAEAVERGNSKLNSNEQVKKFTVLPTVWLPDSAELTPTAKLKRRAILSKYTEEIDRLYN